MDIISTIGPSIIENYELTRIVREGCTGFRFNWSHSEEKKTENQIRYIKERHTSEIIIDLKGHKIKTSSKLKHLNVQHDEDIYICNSKYYEKLINTTDKKLLPIDVEFEFNKLFDSKIAYLKNGNVQFKLNHFNNKYITATVIGNGKIKCNTGINFPGINRENLQLTNDDKKAIVFALDVEADTIYISYVSDAAYVKQVKRFIKRLLKLNIGYKLPKLYSKIETEQGIKNFEEILKASDGIVLGRGDLSNEINLFKYPLIQEKIINRMKRINKKLILATQIAPSLQYKKRASVPEICDLYNHIKNKVKGIVLVGETAVSSNPWRNVRFVARFINEYEKNNEMELDTEIYESSN